MKRKCVWKGADQEWIQKHFLDKKVINGVLYVRLNKKDYEGVRRAYDPNFRPALDDEIFWEDQQPTQTGAVLDRLFKDMGSFEIAEELMKYIVRLNPRVIGIMQSRWNIEVAEAIIGSEFDIRDGMQMQEIGHALMEDAVRTVCEEYPDEYKKSYADQIESSESSDDQTAFVSVVPMNAILGSFITETTFKDKEGKR